MFRSVAAGCVVALASVVSAQQNGPNQSAADPMARIRQHTVQDLVLPGAAGGAVRVPISLGGVDTALVLAPHSVRGGGFRLVVETAPGVYEEQAAPAASTYRGVVEGVAGSVVAASLIDGQLHAMIDVGDEEVGYWWIQPMSEFRAGAAEASHLVFASRDVRRLPMVCGVPDLPAPGGDIGGAGGADDPQEGDLICDLAIDTDFEFYTLRGSNQATALADIELLIDTVNVIYERDVDVSHKLGTVIIRTTSADPYTTSDGSALLSQFAAHWQSNQQSVVRDVAHLVSGRDFSGFVLGVAFLSGVCSTSIGYGVVQTPGLLLIDRTAVSAHEIGHNFSAPHCDALPDCRIMCSGIGGCTGNRSSFGATEIAQIKGYAAGRPCLTPFVVPPAPLPFTDAFPVNPLDPNKWKDVVGAVVGGTGVNEISPPNAMTLSGTATARTVDLDAPATLFPKLVYISFWSQHRFAEVGDTLKIEYFRSTLQVWKELATLQSDGTDQTKFYPNEWTLPLDGYGQKLKIRFTASGDGTDLWYVDDFRVGLTCMVDLDASGTLDFFDFVEFQDLFAVQADRADWNRDGSWDFFDFIGFADDFGAGCY